MIRASLAMVESCQPAAAWQRAINQYGGVPRFVSKTANTSYQRLSAANLSQEMVLSRFVAANWLESDWNRLKSGSKAGRKRGLEGFGDRSQNSAFCFCCEPGIVRNHQKQTRAMGLLGNDRQTIDL